MEPSAHYSRNMLRKRKRGVETDDEIDAYNRATIPSIIAPNHNVRNGELYNLAVRAERISNHEIGYLYVGSVDSNPVARSGGPIDFGPSDNTIDQTVNEPYMDRGSLQQQNIWSGQGNAIMWNQGYCLPDPDWRKVDELEPPDGMWDQESRDMTLRSESRFPRTWAGLGSHADDVSTARGCEYGPINYLSLPVDGVLKAESLPHHSLYLQPPHELPQVPFDDTKHTDLIIPWDGLSDLGLPGGQIPQQHDSETQLGPQDVAAQTQPLYSQQSEHHSIKESTFQDLLVGIPQLPVGNRPYSYQGPWNHMVPFLRNNPDHWDQYFNVPEGQENASKQPTQTAFSEYSFRSTLAMANSSVRNSPPYHPGNISQPPSGSQSRKKLTESVKRAGQVVWGEVITSSSNQGIDNLKVGNGARRKTGYRTGPLDIETAKGAAYMRGIGSCWGCWLSKVKCSPGKVCDRCQTIYRPPTSIRGFCYRQRLCDYTNLFFPDILVSHFQDAAVDGYIEKNTCGFMGARATVHVSSGPRYPSLIISVREFRPRDISFLALQHIEKSEDGQAHRLSPSYAPPLGLDSRDNPDLGEKCLNHIKAIANMGRDYGEVKFGEMSQVSWRALEIIDRYRRATEDSNKSQLLYKAKMLYAMHYFMSRVILLTESSLSAVHHALPSPTPVAYDFSLTPRLLHRQIKREVHTILRHTTREVLESLENELRTRKRSSWPTTFCTILILCLCIEAVQVAADAFVVYTKLSNGGDPKMRRETAIHIARDLDDRPYTDLRTLFHAIYKSHKFKKGRKPEKPFNPIRDGLQANKEGFGEEEVQLVEGIRQLIREHRSEIENRAAELSLFNGTDDDMLDDHMKFRAKNSGRLVSRFIMSFYSKHRRT